MRRFVIAAVIGSLALTACTDQQRESPTEPSVPSNAATTKCGAVPFPSAKLASLMNKIFPNGKLRLEAVARAGVVALLWDTCQKSAAQKAVVSFVDWMNQNLLAGKLTGTATDRSQVIAIMFNGVGLSIPTSTNMGPDFGIGFFDPNSTNNTVIKNQNNTALVELEPGSFTEPTTIVLSRNSDKFLLTDFDGEQFPPYFDYNAVNASGNHILENGKTAIVGFCLLDPAVQYPENPRIGHNPVQINKGAPSGLPAFEILDPVDLGEEGLTLQCGNLQPRSLAIGGFGQGLPGLANAAWTTAKYYLSPVAESLLLPQALHAATVGTLPPPGGRASGLSPFGIVEFSGNQIESIGGDLGGEGQGPYFAGEPLDMCHDGCFPEFRVTDGESTIQTPTDLTVALIPGEGSTGTLSGTTTKSTSGTSPYTAEFNDLTISQPGMYQLRVSAPGLTSYTTGSFTVTENPALKLFAVSSFGTDISKRGSLYSINSRTGSITWIGRLSPTPGQYTIATNMAIRQSDQKIFVWAATEGVLLTVDPVTGLGTPVSETTPPAGTPIPALAFSPDGTLYGIEDGAVEGFFSNLVSIDPSTGVRTPIGPLGSNLRISGAEFDCSGTLYGIELSTVSSRMVTINLSTGAATVVGTLSPNMTNIQSIVFMPSGTLTATAGNLFDINPASGAVSNVRPLSPSDVTPQGLGSSRTCVIFQ